jgi:hypothetical protein
MLTANENSLVAPDEAATPTRNQRAIVWRWVWLKGVRPVFFWV